MVVFVNRVKVTTDTLGTDDIVLEAPFDGFQSFVSAGVADGDTVRYTIEAGNTWEIGTGVFTLATNTMSRSPIESASGGSRINLGGNSVVFLTAAGEDITTPARATNIALSLVIALG